MSIEKNYHIKSTLPKSIEYREGVNGERDTLALYTDGLGNDFENFKYQYFIDSSHIGFPLSIKESEIITGIRENILEIDASAIIISCGDLPLIGYSVQQISADDNSAAYRIIGCALFAEGDVIIINRISTDEGDDCESEIKGLLDTAKNLWEFQITKETDETPNTDNDVEEGVILIDSSESIKTGDEDNDKNEILFNNNDQLIEDNFIITGLDRLYSELCDMHKKIMPEANEAVPSAGKGRPSTFDPDNIIAELWRRYPSGTPLTLGELRDSNPDLQIKTLMNNASDLYGMPLAKYLLLQGILLPAVRTRNASAKANNDGPWKVEENDESWKTECLSVIEEILKRYEGDKCVSSIEQLKAENPDIASKFSKLMATSKELLGTTFGKYMKEKGVIRGEDYKGIIDNIIIKYKNEGKTVISIEQLKAENPDFNSTIERAKAISKEIFGMPLSEYLKDQGILKNYDKKAEWNAVIEEIIRRYEGGRTVASVEQIKKENPDLETKIQSLTMFSKELFGMPLSEYLKDQGVIEIVDKEAECKALVEEIIRRYEGDKKVSTIDQLMEENPDIASNISSAKTIFKKIYGTTFAKYLKEKGVIQGEDYREVVNEILRRYEGDRYVASIEQLKAENPDIASKLSSAMAASKELLGTTFVKYLKEKGVIQNPDHNKVIETVDEILKRYEGNKSVESVKQLKEENPDIKEEISKAIDYAWSIYGKSLADYLTEKRVVVQPEFKLAVDNIISKLKERYEEGSEIPNTFEKLTNDNSDLDFSHFNAWTVKAYGMKAIPYLKKQGLISDSALYNHNEALIKSQEKKEALIKKRAEEEARREEERIKKEEDARAELNQIYSEFEKLKAANVSESVKYRAYRLFKKLDAFYPDKKLFSMTGICPHLRDTAVAISKIFGYDNTDAFLSDYGYEVIRNKGEVYNLRKNYRCKPGEEPEIIKDKVNYMLEKLDLVFPNHVIDRGLSNLKGGDVGDVVTGLWQWMGYESAEEMLTEYGYEYNLDSLVGRKSIDYDNLINTLLDRYKDKDKPKNVGILMYENQDLKGNIKSLINKSNELFGMTAAKYFKQIGLLESSDSVHVLRTERNNTFNNDELPEAVLSALSASYANVSDTEKYGTYDEAVAALKEMVVRRNAKGHVIIKKEWAEEEKVIIPYGVDEINGNAFANNKKVKEIIIKAELELIPASAFSGCSQLEKVVLPESVQIIEPYAFEKCKQIKSIVLPKSLQMIKRGAFIGCSNLENVEIQNPYTSVEETAFNGCIYQYMPPVIEESEDEKYFEFNITRQGTVSVSKYKGKSECVVIPTFVHGKLVTEIGKGAFEGNMFISEISMSDQITGMQNNAFKDCISLKRVKLSNGIKKIFAGVFSGCKSLSEINIPDGVTDLPRYAFKDSPLSTLYIGKSASILDSRNFFSNEYNPATGKITATRAIKIITVDNDNPYMTSSGSMILSKDGTKLLCALGSSRSYVIPNGVVEIMPYAFANLARLSDVSLPESLELIGDNAFSDTAVRTISFGKSVKRIGDDAFKGCDKLTSVLFNEGLEVIGKGAFRRCPIIRVYLPSSLKTLGDDCFDCLYGGDYNYTQILDIDSGNPYISSDSQALYIITDKGKILQKIISKKFREYVYNFYGNNRNNISYAVQPGTVEIMNNAFERCSALNDVYLPEGIKIIGDNAFYGCSSMNDITLPSSIESIGSYAFNETEIKSFSLGSSVTSIGEGAFITGSRWNAERTKLREIKVDKGNEKYYTKNKMLLKKNDDSSVSLEVYYGGQEKVVIPEEVSVIKGNAFSRSIVQQVQIPVSVKEIGDNAFSGCNKLVRIILDYGRSNDGNDNAIIYIPEITKNQYGSSDTQLHDQFMDCIRTGEDGEIFDFIKYDSLFDTVSGAKDKVLVATDRLKSAIDLVPVYRDNYIKYLRRNADKAIDYVIEYDDLSGLNTLAEYEIFTGRNIDRLIELANRAKQTEILSFLMDYKNDKIGITETDYDL